MLMRVDCACVVQSVTREIFDDGIGELLKNEVIVRILARTCMKLR